MESSPFQVGQTSSLILLLKPKRLFKSEEKDEL